MPKCILYSIHGIRMASGPDGALCEVRRIQGLGRNGWINGKGCKPGLIELQHEMVQKCLKGRSMDLWAISDSGRGQSIAESGKVG